MTASPSRSDSAAAGSLFQNSVYIGINIENILYGIALLLYFQTLHILLRNKADKSSNAFYAIFSTIMVFFVTVWIATQAIFGEEMWILASDFPGGPDAYWNRNISIWYMDWATTAVIILQLMTDGLMIYRCRIIWDSYLAIIVPLILWLATLILGVLVDWTSSLPGADFYTGDVSQLVLSYCAVSVFLHIVLTCMICFRILQYGRRIRERLGHEYASLYFAIITLIIESVLPYTLSGIAFLVSLGIGSPTSVAFVCVYFLMMCISPQMLILRVLAGRAWNSDAVKRPRSTIDFGPVSSTSGSQGISSRASRVHEGTLSDVQCLDGHGKEIISPV